MSSSKFELPILPTDQINLKLATTTAWHLGKGTMGNQRRLLALVSQSEKKCKYLGSAKARTPRARTCI